MTHCGTCGAAIWTGSGDPEEGYCLGDASHKPEGVDLLDTGGCPSMQRDVSSYSRRPFLRTCFKERGHGGLHESSLGFKWTDEQEVKA